jgi:hypothetical protein
MMSFALTDRRVIAKEGMVRHKSFDIMLAKVEGVGANQGLLGRQFGYGDITVSGTGGSKDPIKGIEDPYGFRAAMDDHEYDSAVKDTGSGGEYDEPWSVGNRRHAIGLGDHAYLLRQHAERGITAAGYFTSDVLELTRLLGHQILGLGALEEGAQVGSSIEVSGGVPA